VHSTGFCALRIVVLGMPASQVEVRITNSNYQKLAP
jgi:hypothetical protein